MRTFCFYLPFFTFPGFLFAQSGSVYRNNNIMNGNSVQTVFGNWGVVAQPRNAGPVAAWPYPSNGYFGDFSILIGARIPYGNSSFVTVTDCPVNRPSSGGFDESPTGVRNAFEPLQFGPSNLAMSDNPASWPPGWTQWPFQAPATLESYFIMDDNNDDEFNYASYNFAGIQFKPDSSDTSRSGMALKIKTRYRQFVSAGLQDMLILEYNLINEGTTGYRQMVFGGLMGTYVGVTGNDDSYGEWFDDASFFDIENSYAFFWDFNMDAGWNPYWIGDPGFAAVALLQSPANPFDGIDNDRDNALSPGSSASFFTAADFNQHTIQAGETIILIDENYNRSAFIVPATAVDVTTCGTSFHIIPGTTTVREGNSGNPNSFDGIDNDFDGLIDESYDLHYAFDAPPLNTPLQVSNSIGPTQHIDYFTGQGLSDSHIDETGNDVDEIGLTSFDYFVPAYDISMQDDNEMFLRMSPGFFDLPSSYQNGSFPYGEDGDFILGSGFFTLEPGDSQKVVLGIIYAQTPQELKSKVQLANAVNWGIPENANLQITSSPSGIYTGNTITFSWQSSIYTGNIILEYSSDDGSSWNYVKAFPPHVGIYHWNISNLPDGIFYKIRIRHSLDPMHVFTSNRFTINHPGQANPQVLFTAAPISQQSVSDSLEISWISGDADGDAVTVSLYISTQPDTAWEFLTSLPDSGRYIIDTRQFPNTEFGLLRLAVWDGFNTGQALSQRFRIENNFPVLPDTLYSHTNGNGAGIFKVLIVDSTQLTGHQYLVTFDDTSQTKTYSVKDLDLNQYVVSNCPQLDSTLLGPQFDGVRLMIQDLDQVGFTDSTATWSNSNITAKVDILFESIQVPSIGVIHPQVYPFDYQIVFYDHVVDTTLNSFRNVTIPGVNENPASFRIRNTVTGEFADFFWQPQDTQSTMLGLLERVIIVEKDHHNVDQLNFQFLLHADTSQIILPQPGDTLFITPEKPFSRWDQFRFTTGQYLPVTKSDITPLTYQLFQNYPNPFNPVTTLRFSLPIRSEVKIEIFDILGRKIRELANRKFEAGVHQIQWDGRNDSHTAVASGIYMTVFKTGDFVKLRKMVLIR